MIENGTAPISIRADVGHACHAGGLVAEQRAVDDLGDRGAFAACVGVGPQGLFKQRPQVHQVSREAEVFLRDLHFQHERRVGCGAEQGMKGLAGLKVDRAVLYLQHDVVAELTVQRNEFRVRLFGAVLGLIL